MSSVVQHIPQRVRDLRIDRGWTLRDLAERAGSSVVQISRLERGQRVISLEWAEKIAAAFDVPLSTLLFAENKESDVRRVPVIGSIAAGNWREAIEDPLGFVAALNVSPYSFALRAEGDSMDLILPDGGYAVLDPDNTSLRDGGIYAVMNDGCEATIKRYRADPSRLEPCSSNPAHKAIQIGQEPFRVIGRMVASVVNYT